MVRVSYEPASLLEINDLQISRMPESTDIGLLKSLISGQPQHQTLEIFVSLSVFGLKAIPSSTQDLSLALGSDITSDGTHEIIRDAQIVHNLSGPLALDFVPKKEYPRGLYP